MIAGWLKFWRLCAEDRKLVLEGALLVETVRLALWMLPFRTARAVVAAVARARPTSARSSAGRIAWAMDTIAGCLPSGTCLAQALTAQALLERRGWPAQLRIGVRRAGGDGAVRGHAWVESAGTTVVGGTGLSFHPLSIPSGGRLHGEH